MTKMKQVEIAGESLLGEASSISLSRTSQGHGADRPVALGGGIVFGELLAIAEGTPLVSTQVKQHRRPFERSPLWTSMERKSAGKSH